MNRLLLHFSILVPLSFLVFSSCKSLRLRVGSQNSQDQNLSQIAEESGAANLYQSWNSMQENMERLEELKKVGAEAFLRRYHEEGRRTLRQTMRQFRDAISRNADSRHSVGHGSLGKLKPGQCLILKTPDDLFCMHEYGDIRPLLQTAVLSKLEASDAPLMNSRLPESIDQVTKLVFFELGIKLDGSSRFHKKEALETINSNIRWQVIHEKGESESLKALDANAVLLSFDHQKRPGGEQSLELEALVGKEILDGSAKGVRNFMRLSYQQSEKIKILEIQNGKKDKDDKENLVFNRRLVLAPKAEQSRKLRFTDTLDFDSKKASVKTYTIDLDQLSICAEQETATTPTPEPKPPAKPDADKGNPKPAPTATPPKDNPGQNKSENPSQNKGK